MKLSFPYMGETTVAYQKLANLLGHELVIPPKPTQKTVNLGVRYAPEFACFPLKVLLGTYLEEIELGADTIISSGGNGPCRAGYYGEVHKKILADLGYDTRVIILDSFNGDVRGLWGDIKYLKGHNSWWRMWQVMRLIYRALHVLDEADRQLASLRPYEKVHGAANRAWTEILGVIDKANTLPELEKARRQVSEIVHSVDVAPVAPEDRVRIGIVGEIYVVMENSVNMQMEQKINELGCEVRRSQYLSDWVDYHLLPHFISKPLERVARRKGEGYFPIPIGGHAQENMGWIQYFKEQGYDGVVHILPFGCLPELMSQSIIPGVSQKLDIPVISFPMDEQSGLANNMTRLEAFIDLIRAKKGGPQFEKVG